MSTYTYAWAKPEDDFYFTADHMTPVVLRTGIKMSVLRVRSDGTQEDLGHYDGAKVYSPELHQNEALRWFMVPQRATTPRTLHVLRLTGQCKSRQADAARRALTWPLLCEYLCWTTAAIVLTLGGDPDA